MPQIFTVGRKQYLNRFRLSRPIRLPMVAAMTVIYKICPSAAWNEACAAGTYAGSDDDRRDGFIHLSAAHQLAGTLARHFAGRDGLVLIAFDEEGLAGLRWEPSRGGMLFPHVYGVLSVSRARWVKNLPLQNGVHVIPPEAT